MAVNVGQALLHDAENCGFHVRGEAAQVLGYFELNFDLAAFRKSLDVPVQSRAQADFVQQRRMQQVRNGADFSADLLHQFRVLRDRSGSRFVELVNLPAYYPNVHADGRE